MKVELKFGGSYYEVKNELVEILQFYKYKAVIRDFLNEAHKLWKYSEDEKEVEFGERARDLMWEVLKDNEVELD